MQSIPGVITDSQRYGCAPAIPTLRHCSLFSDSERIAEQRCSGDPQAGETDSPLREDSWSQCEGQADGRGVGGQLQDTVQDLSTFPNLAAGL